MATNSVPGADAKNLDKLDIGCWAEDDQKTSLIFVAGRETGRVVYQMYDLVDGYFYNDAMLEADFKSRFSVPPVGNSPHRWTWHDKTPFPWDRVMSRFQRPVPQFSDVEDQLSTAQKVAQALGLRGRKLTEEDVTPQVEQRRRRGYAIMDRIAEVVGRIMDDITEKK